MLNEGNVFPNPKPVAPFCLQIASPSSSSSRRAVPPQLPETAAKSKSRPFSREFCSEDASLLPSGDSSLDFLFRPSLQELCLRNCADFNGKLFSELGRYCKDLRLLYLSSLAEKRGRSVDVSHMEDFRTQLEVGRAGRFGTKGLAITFVSSASDSMFLIRFRRDLKLTSKSFQSRLIHLRTVFVPER